MEGTGLPGSPELGCRELKGQAEVEEEELFYDPLSLCWMITVGVPWVCDLTELSPLGIRPM